MGQRAEELIAANLAREKAEKDQILSRYAHPSIADPSSFTSMLCICIIEFHGNNRADFMSSVRSLRCFIMGALDSCFSIIVVYIV